MNIYEVDFLKNQIEKIASENEGEIPDEMMKALVEAECSSVQQIEKLVKYVRYLELGIDNCKAEEDRIRAMRQKAEDQIVKIKKYLTPYFQKNGSIKAGTFRIYILKSEQVIDDIDFLDEKYIIEKIERRPDKMKIKADLKAGKTVNGASLQINYNLQIK